MHLSLVVSGSKRHGLRETGALYRFSFGSYFDSKALSTPPLGIRRLFCSCIIPTSLSEIVRLGPYSTAKTWRFKGNEKRGGYRPQYTCWSPKPYQLDWRLGTPSGRPQWRRCALGGVVIHFKVYRKHLIGISWRFAWFVNSPRCSSKQGLHFPVRE